MLFHFTGPNPGLLGSLFACYTSGMTKKDYELLAHKATKWLGSPTSIIVHTLFFALCFSTVIFGGVEFDKMLLVLTTIVSLEAIYLSLFIQMSVNMANESIDEVEKDVDAIQKDVGEIQTDVDEIQKDIDEVQEDVGEMQEDVEEIQKDIDEVQEDVEEIQKDVEEVNEGVEEIQKDVEDMSEDEKKQSKDARAAKDAAEKAAKMAVKEEAKNKGTDKTLEDIVKALTKLAIDVKKLEQKSKKK